MQHRGETSSESPVALPVTATKEFAAGDVVLVQPRTWSGMNRPGGTGRVTKVNGDGTYNVKYILGGSDKSVHPAFMDVQPASGQQASSSPASSSAATAAATGSPTRHSSASSPRFSNAAGPQSGAIVRAHKTRCCVREITYERQASFFLINQCCAVTSICPS
jgi:hypothetical protein